MTARSRAAIGARTAGGDVRVFALVSCGVIFGTGVGAGVLGAGGTGGGEACGGGGGETAGKGFTAGEASLRGGG
jgi:hypothetical protein